MQNAIDRRNDKLLKRKEIMERLRFKSINTYYKWKRESGIKVMQISGGIEVVWESDIIKYLEELQNNVA